MNENQSTSKKCFYIEQTVKICLGYKEIEKISEFIKNNPNDDYTIELSTESGIGQGVDIADNFDMNNAQDVTDYNLW